MDTDNESTELKKCVLLLLCTFPVTVCVCVCVCARALAHACVHACMHARAHMFNMYDSVQERVMYFAQLRFSLYVCVCVL